MTLRVVIVGGVAGGMSAAARLRRLDESASITVLERSAHVSYANCGLPYFVSGVIDDEDALVLQTPEGLFERFRLDVRVDTEVFDIDPVAHTVTARSTNDGATSVVEYDKLVLSPGAAPARAADPGLRARPQPPHRRGRRPSSRPTLRVAQRHAVIIGAGFVGLETAENLAAPVDAGHDGRGCRPGAHEHSIPSSRSSCNMSSCAMA